MSPNEPLRSGKAFLVKTAEVQSAPFREGSGVRVRLSVRSNPRGRFADPGATRPAAWRAVARAHLPSWPIFQGTPQPGGRLAPRLPGDNVTERRSLRDPGVAECAFP